MWIVAVIVTGRDDEKHSVRRSDLKCICIARVSCNWADVVVYRTNVRKDGPCVFPNLSHKEHLIVMVNNVGTWVRTAITLLIPSHPRTDFS